MPSAIDDIILTYKNELDHPHDFWTNCEYFHKLERSKKIENYLQYIKSDVRRSLLKNQYLILKEKINKKICKCKK